LPVQLHLLSKPLSEAAYDVVQPFNFGAGPSF
jgi:hypothetical protein